MNSERAISLLITVIVIVILVVLAFAVIERI